MKDWFKVIIIGGVFFGLFMTIYPPAKTAMATPTPTATLAAHGTHNCDSAAPTAKINGVLTAEGKQPTEIMIGNFNPTPVFLVSTNGNPVAQGWPICTDPLQCASAVSLPVYGGVLSCAPAAGAVTVNVFGVR